MKRNFTICARYFPAQLPRALTLESRNVRNARFQLRVSVEEISRMTAKTCLATPVLWGGTGCKGREVKSALDTLSRLLSRSRGGESCSTIRSRFRKGCPLASAAGFDPEPAARNRTFRCETGRQLTSKMALEPELFRTFRGSCFYENESVIPHSARRMTRLFVEFTNLISDSKENYNIVQIGQCC